MKSDQLIFYTTLEGNIKVEVFYEGETFWLTQKAMANLFGVEVPAVSKHLKNIFDSKELNQDSVISKMETTATDGKKYLTTYYRLEATLAVGYRVNSTQATQFRVWATNTLKEFIIKGFVLDDERLKQGKHFGNLLSLFTTKSRDASPGRLRDCDTGKNLSLQAMEIVDGLPAVRWV